LLNNASAIDGGVLAKGSRRERGDAYESVFIALAHPTRRLILMTLNFEGGEMSAGEIAALFKHAWPTTTRHLRILERAGLLHHQRQGRERLYRIDKKKLELARDWLAWFLKNPG
jgi:DNA-binding transcriptional ArsR family regulator